MSIMNSNTRSVLFFLCAFLCRAACNNNLSYEDLETLGVACPERDRCAGYMHNKNFTERNCECDHKCSMYGDCCIDASLRTSNSRRPLNNVCLNYGDDPYAGVYAVSTCSSSWSGNREVRRKCIGQPDWTDPLTAAPVVSVSRSPGQSKTYRNLFCAECNNANMTSLETFQLKVECNDLHYLTEEHILGDIEYNEELSSWGVYRVNGTRRIFINCTINFDVPSYLNTSVRFCRPNAISTCAPNYTRQAIKRKCEEYMAVVYDNIDDAAYRNPHCALCNYRTVSQITCNLSAVAPRKRPMSFALLLDVNQSDGDRVGMRRVPTPECPSGHKYDPFFKRCRELVCALPGHVVVDGRCVRG